MNIKFGTDGWRAVIAKDFTVENVAKVTSAVSKWLLNKHSSPSVLIGYDCRFGGELFAETVAKVLAVNEIKVFISKSFVSTPMLSLGVLKTKANFGIVITASHNPPSDNGYKLKGHYGGPLLENEVKEIEAMIPEENEILIDSVNWNELVSSKKVVYVDLETLYINHVTEHFDIKKIQNSKFNFAFDAMYGSGQNVIKRLFSNVKNIHCELNPTFKGIAPEPLHKNLQEFSKLIERSNKIDCGLAVDGDADRIAMYDSKGNYIDSHHIILIIIHYLSAYKKLKGKVVTGFSSTVKIEKLASHYGLEVERVKIGFKDICKIMLTEDVLVGGEESGGIAINSHMPERDGIWMGLIIWQFMVETGKSLSKIIQEIYKITGEFAFERIDLKIDEHTKKVIIEKCKNGEFKSFGKFKVKKTDNLDGFKYYFSKNEWLMIRPSGTEPVLRIYSEAKTKDIVNEILQNCKNTIFKT